MSSKILYSLEELDIAVQRVKNKELSYRKAESKYGIPRSTLSDHVTGKSLSSKRGPPTVLTEAEEQMLVDWALHMADIGYGRTREQLCVTVKETIDKDGRENPFVDNYPGRDWWYGFLRRHPILTQRKPENLQSCRASSCTPERLDQWYTDYSEFMHRHGLHNKPQCIWNADESGFPLCPRTSRVLCLRNKKHIYSVNADSKSQITTLVAANAAGSVIPPMHIFPGKRFSYNPLEGAVAGSYMGRSETGWMLTELFYGWLANHFVSHIPPERPVVLLVDGHTTHIDLEISKFCKENGILLYCLLAHSSHITQPLDVGFFGALKNSWAKAVDKYKISHMGSSVTKESFASVFCTAWTGAVKMATIVNLFARSGIYPIDRSAIGNPGPATLYSESTTDSSSASPTSCGLVASESSTIEALSSLVAIENVMDPSTVKRFHRRYNEGCDVNGDELYTVWEQLKKLTLSSQSSGEGENSALTQTSAPLLQSKASTTTQAVPVRQPVSEAFSDILVYPEPITKKSKKPRNPMPSHLNSSQMVEYLSAKRQEKLDKEAEAQQRKVMREAKKAEKEKLKTEKERLKAARLAKKATAQSLATTSKKNGKRRRERRRKSEQGESAKTTPTVAVVEEACFAESESSSTEDLEDSLNACPVCCGTTNGDWVACDNCSQWFHIVCAGIAQDLDVKSSLWNGTVVNVQPSGSLRCFKSPVLTVQ